MFRNYVKTAVRNLLREKSSTFINLAGLTLGITCSLVLFLIITYHNSFDTFHAKRDRIYRIVNQSEGNHSKDYQPGVPAVLPDAFRLDFPEAEEVAFTSYRAGELVTIPQPNRAPKKFREEKGVVFTEPSFLKIFDWNIVQGDGLHALDEPYEAIISVPWAMKYFGKQDVIGEVIKVAQQEYKISAVMEGPPANTDFPFQLMLSYVTIEKEREAEGWRSIWSDEQCYFLVKDDVRIADLESRLKTFTKKHLGEGDFDRTEYLFQPLTVMHFDQRFETYSYSTFPKSMLIAFGVIAAILILTACINFINLATAEAIKRSKEIGIRKALGSSRSQLVVQFLGETMLITFVAVVLALALTQISLTFINPFLDLALSLDLTTKTDLLLYIVAVTLGVSLLSGLYPALVVSGYKPALALKNRTSNKNATGYVLRKALVVLQFSISQLFIIGAIVIIKQTNYFHQKELGFAKDAIVVIPIPGDRNTTNEQHDMNKKRALRDEVARMPGVEKVSLSSAPPFSGNVSKTVFTIHGSDQEYVTQVKSIDGHYLDLYELTLVAGRDLPDRDTANGFVVNEELVRVAGFQSPEEILGQVIRMWEREFPVVGVVKDFHTLSLQHPIEPTILLNNNNGFNTLALNVNLAQMPTLIDAVKEKWESAYPQHLFEYDFLDEDIRGFYESERKMATLLSLFTGMAMFIGCLGLFGLASFMTNQKTKEIGVRKVLGASVESIVFMFFSEYGKLIGLGFLLAAPLAGYAMQQFLNEFAYSIDLGVGIFILGLGITIFIAMITVGYKSFSAAAVNPVRSLRYE